MKLKFYNTPKPAKISSVKLTETPIFTQYKPNFKLIAKMRQQYKKYKNIIIIGNGGSINSFIGIYHALHVELDKKARFLSTIDPDHIARLKKQFKPKDTLVVSISKSGENITQLESTNQFLRYPMLFMSEPGTSLALMSEQLNIPFAVHPPMYGRFAGVTETALLPGGICGLKVKDIYEGAKEIYSQYQKDNLAWQAASVMWQLEQKGFVDVYMPYYTHNLFPMSNLVVQLCHESFGKNGKGQTYFAHEAPESQHHTNQRFFGGRKNICAFFVSAEKFEHKILNIYPQSLKNTTVRGRKFSEINNISLDQAMEYELSGTMKDALNKKIPFVSFSIEEFEPKEIGRFLAFWQMFAVYSAVLRKVNPFNQPEVEASKNISFRARLEHRKV